MSQQKKKRYLYLSFFIATLELLKNAVFLQRAGCGPACGHWAGTQRAKRAAEVCSPRELRICSCTARFCLGMHKSHQQASGVGPSYDKKRSIIAHRQGVLQDRLRVDFVTYFFCVVHVWVSFLYIAGCEVPGSSEIQVPSAIVTM